jgi:CDP-diacylglycerol--serine O-phosphatidyltransferase
MLGLPIPVAATVLISTVMAFSVMGINQTTNHILVAALVIVMSYLMISRVRFRSMKDVKLTKRTTAIIGLLLASAVVVAVQISQPAVLIFLVGCYITLGLIEEMYLLRKGRVERLRAAQAQAQAQLQPTPDDAPTETEVLAELGVDDDTNAAPPPSPATAG